MTLSGGERFQVLAAAKAAKAGWNLKAILERLEKIRENTEVIYTLETLEYLARGGRIGRVQALMGSSAQDQTDHPGGPQGRKIQYRWEGPHRIPKPGDDRGPHCGYVRSDPIMGDGTARKVCRERRLAWRNP